jgi:hypothetical protein
MEHCQCIVHVPYNHNHAMASRVVGGERLGLNVPLCRIEMAQRAWPMFGSTGPLVAVPPGPQDDAMNILAGDRCNIATTNFQCPSSSHPQQLGHVLM